MAHKKKYLKRICQRMSKALLAVFMMVVLLAETAYAGPGDSDREIRGVWFSYLDWQKLSSSEEAYKQSVDRVIDRCVELNMNAIFVQVRADADAMYPSAYYPWSRFLTGTQGKDPGYDPLAYFIQAAHNQGLQFHAWITPFRVTGYQNRWEQVSSQNPAKLWLTDKDKANDHWVLKHGGEYYLNPAIPQVRELIVNGVKEIVRNYEVDGIQYDDGFYPEIDDEDSQHWFDKPEYEASGSRESIADWRRKNINALISSTYTAVKSLKPTVQFGISPEGNVGQLRSDTRSFADIDTWFSRPGYVDYVMPKLYWGFEAKLPGGKAAPYAFENNLKTWIELKKNGKTDLYLGLAMYRAGSGTKDNNTVPEWLRRSDIIKRQVQAGRASGEISGYCFDSYRSFQATECRKEVTNLMKILQ